MAEYNSITRQNRHFLSILAGYRLLFVQNCIFLQSEIQSNKLKNMVELVGRANDIEALNRFEASGKSEFIAILGRRRVGKTFLIQQHFRNRFSFAMTGSIDGTYKEQLHYFTKALHDYGMPQAKPKNWIEAFECLQQLLSQKSSDKRMIVFIDEVPCLDTPRSGFVRALEHFWNAWGVNQDHLMLIVCGSATSWMIRNILDNRGGLHNRVTHEIHLQQFTLQQTEEYLQSIGCNWDRLSIVQSYMAFGGIPYYLSLINPKQSLAQNLDNLYFNEAGELRREHTRLYRSLFSKAENYLKVIDILFENHSGLTRVEIAKKMASESGGQLSRILEDLQYCDFIRHYSVKSKHIKKSGGIYQLTDFFTVFHLTFQKTPTTDAHFWSNHLSSPLLNNWYGLAFERVCMAHIPQIKQALGIDRISAEYYAWRSATDTVPRAQIDLLIERADNIINLCEIKYASEYYTISKDEHDKILRRIASFRSETSCRKGISPTFISTYGIMQGKHSEFVTAEITMDQLFAEGQ